MSARASRIIRKPAADERLVVGDHHPDAHARRAPAAAERAPGSRRRAAGRPRACRRAAQRARACRRSRARCRPPSAGGAAPSSTTSISTASAGSARVTSAASPAWRSVLVSASWTMRYAERSTPGGQRRAAPSGGRRPQSGRRAAAGQLGEPLEGGLRRGRVAPSSGPDRAEQPAQLGQRLAPGALDRPQRGACLLGAVEDVIGRRAWTTITETLWAMTSCSSRAMRACSSLTARRVPRRSRRDSATPRRATRHRLPSRS